METKTFLKNIIHQIDSIVDWKWHREETAQGQINRNYPIWTKQKKKRLEKNPKFDKDTCLPMIHVAQWTPNQLQDKPKEIHVHTHRNQIPDT